MATRTAFLLLRSLLLVAALTAVTAGIAAAKDPKNDDDFTTGIDTHRPPGEIDFFITNDQIHEKELRVAQIAVMLERNASQADATASSIVPTNINLSRYPIFHQKTNYFCVPAVVQSMANYAFGGYNTPTISAVQHSIATTLGTTTSGTYDPKGRSWLNQQFANHGWAWRYAGTTPSTAAAFQNLIVSDLGDARMPMYTRIDLSSGKYTWYQAPHSDGTHVFHAVAVAGYSGSGAYSVSGDPFKVQASPTSNCTGWDSGAADYGCRWGYTPNPTYPTSQYFAALDPFQSVANVWY